MNDMPGEDYFINQLSLMEEAVFLLMDTSEISIDEVINLTYRDFLDSIYDYIIGEPLCPCEFSELYDHMQSYESIDGNWYITNPNTGESHYAFSSSGSMHAIMDYLKSTGHDFIHPDEPLFQCRYGGKISRYHILSIFDEIDELSTAEGCE